MSLFRALYVSVRVWLTLIAFVLLFITAYLVPALFPFVKLALAVFVALCLFDGIMLFRKPVERTAFFARRELPERLSNGDENPVTIYLENRYPFQTQVEIIDEIPFQFQKRDVLFTATLKPHETKALRYELRPTKRGEYNFGAVNVYVMTALQLLKRRYQFSQDKTVAVFPSYLQMRQYELLAISNRLSEIGIKKVRRVGHSMEFEQVRPYSRGDDVRTINWKATARRSDLMVNAFQDEKSQAIYCLIDKGRVMKSPFEGLSLLDYAINASLVLSNIALLKQDRAGLLTFSDRIGQLVTAERRPGHLQKILEVLYRQKTRFLESDYEALYANIRQHIRQRSLLLLFTNFETVNALHRQLPYLRRMAREHLLIVVFFENTELKNLLNNPASTTEEIYQKTIAEKFYYEKKQIVKELQQYGIQTILTAPQELTADTVNKYLELKARGMI
ncbi:uncharacterized protein (DUF58 family) [Larkinella arboricola]|uniref:Uncharacterized protein (DUF58 family) n=1 Tax=Larkinella arboricola TaxID=643671 RepID=A0A327X533_LARAB|nr:DUF58 domain-containing protein [Larkinella arboricola]RAK02005.1 uncharacterized protein (DUF58 family) [Larkinella arboricola]